MTTQKRTRKHWSDRLKLLGACPEKLRWAKAQSSMATAWKKAEVADRAWVICQLFEKGYWKGKSCACVMTERQIDRAQEAVRKAFLEATS